MRDLIRYNPLSGSSFMELPGPIAHKTHSLLNIRNMSDDRCLEWNLVAGLERMLGLGERKTNRTRPEYYRKHSLKLIMTGVDFPTPITQVRNIIIVFKKFLY